MLLSEEASHLLNGATYATVVPLIDGVRGVDAIVEAVAGSLDPAMVQYALLRLEAAGYLTESRPEIEPGVAAFWDGLRRDGDAEAAVSALRAARVRVCSVGAVPTHGFIEALGRFGVTVASAADTGEESRFCSELDVVLTDDYLAEALLPLDAAARAAHR